MPYSNRRRNNSPSIPQTPYQTLIITYPNFDPIYQVILLENSIESNLFLGKEGSPKKGSKDWKEKEVKPQLKSSMFWEKKRKRWWNLQAAGRDSIKRKKERRSQFPILQNPMCGLIHTHTSFAFALPSILWLFPSLPSFTTPLSINLGYLPHKLSRIFLCFYNIQGVA
jgi:hypothetical protein